MSISISKINKFILPVLTVLCLLSVGELWAQNNCLKILYFEDGQLKTVEIESNSNRRFIMCPGLPLSFDVCGASNDLSSYIYETPSRSFDDSPFKDARDEIDDFDEVGTYSVRQFIQGSNNYLYTDVIDVRPDTPPSVSVSACPGRLVQLTFDEGSMYDYFIVDWGEGPVQRISSDTPNLVKVYANPGQKSISVRGGWNTGTNNCTPAELSVAAIESPSAASINRLEADSPSSFSMRFDLPAEVPYTLVSYEVGSPAQTNAIAQLGHTETSHSFNFNNPNNRPMCFTIISKNDCDIGGDELRSNSVCYTPFSLTNQDKQVSLSWQPYPEPDNLEMPAPYTVERISDDGYSRTTNGTNLVDNTVICGVEFSYRLTVRLANAEVLSPVQTVTAGSDLKPPVAISPFATYSGAGVSVSWQYPNFDGDLQTQLHRVVDGAERLIYDGTANTFTDDSPPDSRSVCYRLRIYDECGAFSDVSEVCPVFLRGSKQEADNFLNWTEYKGFPDVEYELLVINDNELLRFSRGFFDPGQTTFIDLAEDIDRGEMVYRVKAVNLADPTVESFSNIVKIREEVNIRLPQAFSPNGDGLNDTFKVIGRGINTFRMVIFNNWGEAVFSSEDPEIGWDGGYKDQPAPQGLYTYSVEASNFLGENTKLAGTVLLVR